MAHSYDAVAVHPATANRNQGIARVHDRGPLSLAQSSIRITKEVSSGDLSCFDQHTCSRAAATRPLRRGSCPNQPALYETISSKTPSRTLRPRRHRRIEEHVPTRRDGESKCPAGGNIFGRNDKATRFKEHRRFGGCSLRTPHGANLDCLIAGDHSSDRVLAISTQTRRFAACCGRRQSGDRQTPEHGSQRSRNVRKGATSHHRHRILRRRKLARLKSQQPPALSHLRIVALRLSHAHSSIGRSSSSMRGLRETSSLTKPSRLVPRR
jgi:hypothetical protein